MNSSMLFEVSYMKIKLLTMFASLFNLKATWSLFRALEVSILRETIASH